MLISKACRAALAILLAGFALIASAQDDSRPLRSVQDFLLASSASDFAAHERTRPAKVRNVYLRYSQENGGERIYMLCGQFQPASSAEQPVWADFATVKTEGYEQWLGAHAAALCTNTSAPPKNAEDLSAALQARLISAPSVSK